jgi:hypothetical protein
MKKIFLCIILGLSITVQAQQKAISFDDAVKFGMNIEEFDKNYKSALHEEASKAVFKTPEEQAKLQQAYVKLLQDFGSFLSQNKFQWKKKTRCFQRIYFSPDGTIDYFIYNFNLKNLNPADIPSKEKQTEFRRLLSLFIKDYVFAVTANEPFAQCSPTTYQ